MKIIIVGSYRWEIYAPAFADAFESLGHQVLRLDYENYHLKHNNFVANILNRVQDRYLYGIIVSRFNSDIVKSVRRFNPDLVFLYRCYHVYDSTICEISKWTTVFSYNNDDPFSGIPSKSFYRRNISNSRYCSLNYVYRKKNIDDYVSLGINNTKVLLPYYLAKKNYAIEGMKRDIPIVYMGHWENDGRDNIIKNMIEAGLPVFVFGDISWSKSQYYDLIKGHLFPPKYGKDYNETMNRAKIALVFLSQINHDKYTRRCFEIPATKTLMISPYTDEMLSLFPENEAAVYYENSTDLIHKCQNLLSDDNQIHQIAEGGFSRLQEIGGSEIDRVNEIIADLIRINDEK